MFGYVNINKQELKVKEYYKYKAYYCGLCHQLKKNYGRFGQMTLTYDMTFLIILLTSLYESNVTQDTKRCLVHPTSKHWILTNEISDYAADMNIALTYHKLMDDWQDDRSVISLSGANILKHRYQRVEKTYPRQCEVIKSSLIKLNELEKKKEQVVDIISRPFGELMGELFVYKEDVWKDTLRSFGFYLGKFIYLLDAYDDLEKDLKNQSYNPFIEMLKQDGFEEKVKEILTSMMAECTREFEKLPLIWDVELLRNILYAGVWKKYDEKQNKQEEKGENN
ncbi:MAG: DUF5685 family protein [Clostridiales bacterium]|nr:DUF5685 family protein [Clostridiales bacterium]